MSDFEFIKQLILSVCPEASKLDEQGMALLVVFFECQIMDSFYRRLHTFKMEKRNA